MIKLGTNDMAKAYVGSSEISKMYLGSDLVYSKGSEVLPYDAEIQYLQSDSLAWINTGISGGNNNLEIGIVFSISTWVNSACLYGNFRTDTGSTGNITRLCLSSNGVNIRSGINTTTAGEMLGTCALNVKHTVVSTRGKIIFDGIEATQAAQNGTTNNDNIILYNRGVNAVVDRNIGQKIYSFYIKNGDTLVLDMIPVRVGQVGYMYDKVSKQLFGNAGSGSFILGNDISTLPYDSEIEYLRSTGNGQYINTGIPYDSSMVVDARLMLTDAASGNYMFGIATTVNGTTQRWAVNASSSNRVQLHFGTTTTIYANFSRNTWHTIHADYRYLTVDTTKTDSTANAFEPESDVYLFIFARSSNNSPSVYREMNVGYFKITKNDILVRDYIPVRVGTVGYLYDKISGQLFGNAGTDSFVLGPDI